jgi:RasGEF domain
MNIQAGGVPFMVMDFDKTEIARHLCVLEFEAFAKILPTECLNQAWNKKNKETNAFNITAIIKRFNEVRNRKSKRK